MRLLKPYFSYFQRSCEIPEINRKESKTCKGGPYICTCTYLTSTALSLYAVYRVTSCIIRFDMTWCGSWIRDCFYRYKRSRAFSDATYVTHRSMIKLNVLFFIYWFLEPLTAATTMTGKWRIYFSLLTFCFLKKQHVNNFDGILNNNTLNQFLNGHV